MSEGGRGAPLADRPALVEHVARLKHDLGKYVSLRIRWLPERATDEERRSAVVADLLSTRTGADGVRDAWAIWTELSPELLGQRALADGSPVDLAADPEVMALTREMTEIARVVAELRSGTADDAWVRRGMRAALRVTEACRSLDQRARAAVATPPEGQGPP